MHFRALAKTWLPHSRKNAGKERNLQFKGDIFRGASFCHIFHDTLLVH